MAMLRRWRQWFVFGATALLLLVAFTGVLAFAP